MAESAPKKPDVLSVRKWWETVFIAGWGEGCEEWQALVGRFLLKHRGLGFEVFVDDRGGDPQRQWSRAHRVEYVVLDFDMPILWGKGTFTQGASWCTTRM